MPVDAPEDAVIDGDEIDYLCAAVNRYFTRQITPADVTSTWSGVRPLYDDGADAASEITRDYVLELDTSGPPLLSVFGGKITTARHLAEEAMGKLASTIGTTVRPVSRTRPLPGGDIGRFDTFLADVRRRYPFLGDPRSDRLARAYGAMLIEMLDGVDSEAAMGRDFGHGLTEVELRWMRTREWAHDAADALDRRSKLGLVMSPAQRAQVDAWFNSAPL